MTSQRRVRFLNATNPHLGVHYPTINVVHYLHRDEAVLSVGVCQTAEAHNFLELGACLAEAIRRTPDARVALLGSGGMRHTFWPLDVILDHASFHPTTSSRRRRAPSTSGCSGIGATATTPRCSISIRSIGAFIRKGSSDTT